MASGRSIKAGSAFVQFFLDDGKLQRGLKTTEARLRQFGSKVRNIGAGALTAGFAGLTAIAFPFAKLAEFDDAIRAVGAVTMATAAELRSMEAAAAELGRTTSFTAVEVASLMTELGRAGFNPDQINEMTDAVLNLSRATGTEAALSAGIMAASIRQFSLGAADATRIANVLTVAANSTFNSVEQLGESLSYAGPVAADLGMSLEDTVAILGTLGNVGIQGSNAGTALRRLGTLGAAEAEKLQRIFGVAFKDAQGNARPLIDALGDVAAATDGLPTAERAEAFNEAFGLLGITGASAISKSAGATKELAEQLKNVSTEAADAAAAMDAGPGGMIRRLQSAFEGLQIAIGKAVEALVSGFGEDLTAMIGTVTTFIERNQALVILFAKVAAGVSIAGAGLITLGSAMQVAAFATGGLSTSIVLASKVVGVLSSVSLAGLYKTLTVHAIPSLYAMTTAANLAKVGMLGLKIAMGGAALYAIYKISSAIYAANGNLREFNQQIKESNRLTDKLASRQEKLQKKTFMAADRLTGKDQEQFLRKKLEQAEKELAGQKASIKGQQKIVGGLDTAFNNATGNKVLEGERQTLTDLQGRARSQENFIEQLKDALEAAQMVPPEPVEPETSEDKIKQQAAEASKESIEKAEAEVASSTLSPDAETLKLISELRELAQAGNMGGNQEADEITDAIEQTEESRIAGVEAAANAAVDFRSSRGQEELAKAFGAISTEDQIGESIKKQTKELVEESKKLRDLQKKAPALKVSKT